ncbi:urease accessory protein UreD [Pseudoflavitalea sp. G-6-1-2]|uniref:urease accessory protein UreD n=1 Tax=Pseudoflavitalea sp. G-6-1-2 TaxID=2728841 RepID=UPI0019820865|nr:urease accessory protein UreD [Pseudoflavitalea sp. G-6-1-2]
MIQKDNSISSRIVLSCKLEDNKTMLQDSYFDIPYKIVHYGSRHLQDHLEIMMMCYSPGVMDGDNLHIDVHCPANTEMKLFTQSFNKLHPMEKGAVQHTEVRIDAGASFQYLPQPMIPFKNSLFDTTNEIRMKGNSHLIWGDIISGGRIHSGERFEFTRIHSKTKVYVDEKLIFFDNQLMQPTKQPIEDILFFEGHTHQGTLLIVSPYAVEFKAELDEILLAQFTDMIYGFTQCGPNAIMIRTLGESGDAMHEWLANIGDMCWSFIKYKQGNEEPAPVIETIAAVAAAVKKPAVKKTAKKAAAKKAPAKKSAPSKASSSKPTKTATKKSPAKSAKAKVKSPGIPSIKSVPAKAATSVKKSATKKATGKTVASKKAAGKTAANKKKQ